MVTPTLDPPTTGPTGEAPKAHPVFGLTRLKNWTDPIKKPLLKLLLGFNTLRDSVPQERLKAGEHDLRPNEINLK